MKISREGIVLIKSFEGFRPRAIRREEGGWVIGYGHTLSAREGASVSEADAELLLRYDLLPVERTVNQAGAAALNQHQFDALVSFAFSVGVEKFRSSDVLGHLVSGANDEAADALMGWPEPALPQVALRRRAAERALFVADPGAPVAVSDLLVAPIEPTKPVDAGDSHDDATAVVQIAFDPSERSVETLDEQAPVVDPRQAAVSALLGEPEPTTVPTFAPPPPLASTALDDDKVVEAAPSAANDRVADDAVASDAASPPVDDPVPATDAPIAVASVAAPGPDFPEDLETGATTDRIDPMQGSEGPAGTGGNRISSLIVQRYTPYGAAMVGPLPFLGPVREQSDATDSAISVPMQDDEPKTAVDTVVAPDATPVDPFASSPEIEPLVLSGGEDTPWSSVPRDPWTIEERAESVEAGDGGLFGEDLSLTQGGAPVMRHGDIEFEAPASFDWSETGAFIIMGAVGLTAFGAAMAAFRLASEQSGGDETTIIAWVLAVIGAACVGVSSFNLYRRWGLPGGDN